MKKKILALLVFVILFSLNSINGECKTQPVLNRNKFNVINGKTYQLFVKNCNKKCEITWETKDRTIAKVNENGLVSGVEKGETTILCNIKNGNYEYNISAKVKVLGKPNKEDNIKIKTSFERTSVGYQERMLIKAYKGSKLLWHYRTKYATMTELSSYTKVYKKNDMLYFRDVTSLVVLDVKTGKIIWKANGCGAGKLYFDNAGNVYVPGYYGPDIFCVDVNGNVVYSKSYDKNIYWAYNIKIKGDILYLYYSGNIPSGVKLPYKTVKDKRGYEVVVIKINKKTGNIMN